MPNDVALSFDGTEGSRAQPYLRRPTSQFQPQQGRPGPSPANNGPGPGPGPGLQFMNFDLPSGSGSSVPLAHSNTYGGSSSSGYVSLEDEPPLLEGINQKASTLFFMFRVNTSRIRWSP